MLEESFLGLPSWWIDTALTVFLGLIVVETHRRPPGAMPNSQIWLRWAVAMTGYLGVGLVVALKPIGDGWLTGASWVLGLLGGELVARLRVDSSPWLKWAINLMSATVALSPLVIELPQPIFYLPLYTAMAVAAQLVGRLVSEQWRALVRTEVEVREAERRAMAAELHDVIAHEVTGVVVLTQALRMSARPEQAEALARIETAGQRALGEIRALVSTLHTDESATTAPAMGTAEEIEEVVEAFGFTTVANLTYSIDADGIDASRGVTTRRIVSEALTNIRRHADNAKNVEVHVGFEGTDLVIVISDDATGGGLGIGTGLGLASMRQRAELIGGTLSAGPREGGGWRVRAVLPKGGRT
ncbi:MAG: histidine kinase [Marmoricola sp.]